MIDDDDLVCFCTGLTLLEIREAAEKEELHFLYDEGLSQYCGSCREDVKNILQDLIHKGNGEYYIEVLRNNME